MPTITKKPEVPLKTGVALLNDPSLNKGTAFTPEERLALGIQGLLPPGVSTQEMQAKRATRNILSRSTSLGKYVELINLLDRNETLFYRVVMDNIDKMMPLIYTPTVGEACKEYAHIFRRPRGIFITPADKGRVREVLGNWPHKDIRIIVVTDGERILGLGDLGANGMGIPVGKLSLYTACAGIPPAQTLPVTLDLGTDNPELLADPLYLGVPQKRLRGAAYDEMVAEFMEAAREIFPETLIQFEDFANRNAFRLLEAYRNKTCCFNDDIQGTAAVALAGIYSSERITKVPLCEQRFLFLGAGESAIGIGGLIVRALEAEGLPRDKALRCCWFLDSQGLVQSGRSDLQEHKKTFAHEHPPIATLAEAVETLKPTTLIGVSGQPNRFTAEIIGAMARLNERPVIFALSNPTANAECTAQDAYTHSRGRAVFASGSPFADVRLGATVFSPGQSNNAYIFPGVGLGVLASATRRVDDAMFFAAAKTLADLTTENDLKKGRLFPPLTEIREVSARIAAAVAASAWDRGLASTERPADPLEFVRGLQYQPEYRKFI